MRKLEDFELATIMLVIASIAFTILLMVLP